MLAETQSISSELRLIRLPEVKRLTGLCKSSIYAKDKFSPRRVDLGGRAVAWVESEVQSWVAERIKARDLARIGKNSPESEAA